MSNVLMNAALPALMARAPRKPLKQRRQARLPAQAGGAS